MGAEVKISSRTLRQGPCRRTHRHDGAGGKNNYSRKRVGRRCGVQKRLIYCHFLDFALSRKLQGERRVSSLRYQTAACLPRTWTTNGIGQDRPRLRVWCVQDHRCMESEMRLAKDECQDNRIWMQMMRIVSHDRRRGRNIAALLRAGVQVSLYVLEGLYDRTTGYEVVGSGYSAT